MTPGLSGVKTRGRGYHSRTEQIAVCCCKQPAKHLGNMFFGFYEKALRRVPHVQIISHAVHVIGAVCPVLANQGKATCFS